MALIQFKDSPNTTTPLNSSNLNNNFTYLNEKIEQVSETINTEIVLRDNFINAYCNLETQTISSGNNIPINTIWNSQGNKLTLADNKIYIGAGVKHVRISGAVSSNSVSGRHRVYLWKNNQNILADAIIDTNANSFYTLTFPEQIIQVSEGDYIQMTAAADFTINSGGIAPKSTFLNVQVFD